jgi:Fe-S oxidoreductase
MTPKLKQDIFECLGCEQCKVICPAGIHIPELISAMRSEYVKKDGLPLPQKIVLRGVLPNARRLSLSAKALRLGQKTKLVGSFARCLPANLRGRLCRNPCLQAGLPTCLLR